MNKQTLSQKFDALSEAKLFEGRVSDTVINNLNPIFELRNYQKEAISRFDYYIEDYPERKKPIHLLFHMATGSGKTLIMAACILELYKQGYRNFIFFVNSTNIIEKTRNNFLDPASSKYLFDNKIVIDEKVITVKEVENFEGVSDKDINIVFTTIQGLHTKLNSPSENSITYEDFENKKIVLISDEAHHINALTKSKLTKEEAERLNSWEGTVDRIFKSNIDNIMLEFTATIELSHPAVRLKYQDKILFDYSLKKFVKEKFSKEVKVLQADLSDMDRVLQTVILSQYRRKVAQDNKIFLKPVILMKSKTIKESEEIEESFLKLISNLKVKDIEKLKTDTKSDIVKKAFKYFKEQKITLANLVEELKEEFSKEKCIKVNSKSESDEKQLKVNSLEDKDNEIRVIFAVDKLNEGWDVLNLFDIVRLYDTRDARGNKPGKTTIREAQLIGRGARYFPFLLGERNDKYKRKFDDDTENDLRVVEELYYHSSHNPKYIQELRTALIQEGIWDENTREIKTKVKEEIKKSDFWKKGIIFLNKRVENTRKDIFSFKDVNLPKQMKYKFPTGYTREIEIFSNSNGKVEERKIKTFKLIDFGKNVIRKALDKIEFYQFNRIQQYFPNTNSKKDFISSDKLLGGVEVEVTGNQEMLGNLTTDEKLSIVLKVLKDLVTPITTATSEYIGTKRFKPIAVQYIVKNKTLKIVVNESGDQEYGKGMRETTNIDLQLDLSDKSWYVYEENYGTSEEKYFVKFINSMIEDLKKKYKEVYLLRNERLFKIFRFNDGRAIEPDFVLFLTTKKRKSLTYQLFIEPKGEGFIVKDMWKQEFLLEIKEKSELVEIHRNKAYKVYGLPFYNETLTKKKFNESFVQVLDLN